MRGEGKVHGAALVAWEGGECGIFYLLLGFCTWSRVHGPKMPGIYGRREFPWGHEVIFLPCANKEWILSGF